jgi:hypothetical protein
MKRYKSGILGMKVYDNGDWVQYPIFELLQEKCLANDDLAKHRLDIIQDRNERIIILQKEVEQWDIEYNELIEESVRKINNLEEILNQKDEEIYKIMEKNTSLFYSLEESKKKLNVKSKFTDLKHDTFIFSVVLNIVFILYNTITAFGGIL